MMSCFANRSLCGIILFLVSARMHAAQVELLGAGASFPYPLYSKMFDVYYKQYGIKINYQSIGSGGGIQQLESKSIDFGASDAFMKDEELAKMPGAALHIPMCLGAVVVTYNLPGSPTLKLTSDILADLFLGKVKVWNDPRIQKLNANVKVPATKVMVVHRSDGSGTTSIFTDYLAKASPEWREKVGHGKSVKWPTGLGAKGNEGVSGLVKQAEGSIGYCELAYALHNDLPQAILKNKKGNFIKPEIASISEAANVEIPAHTRVSLTDSDGEKGYPIAGFTWILLYQEQSYDGRSKEKAETLVRLLWWMIHDGQKYCESLDYAPLPKAAVSKAEAIIKSVTFAGKPVHK